MMSETVNDYFGEENILSVVPLAQAGSNRKYARVTLKTSQSYIVCENDNGPENETFFYFTEIFLDNNIAVAKILHISPDRKTYILEDLGNESLLDIVLKQRPACSADRAEEEKEELYQASLQGLLKMQITAGKNIDFDKCFAAKKFDKNAVLSDLNYFKYYFLDLHHIVYDKPQLQQEFDKLAKQIEDIQPLHFMFRDFQGRNIMVKNNTPYFIDYQGGMQGPLQYDVASLLWQAKADLSFELKEKLLSFYKKELSSYIDFNEKEFDINYQKILLTRLLQVLGAYGLRGIIEQRPHFLSSIPCAIKNLQVWYIAYVVTDHAVETGHALSLQEDFPVLCNAIQQILNAGLSEKYAIKKATENSPLKILIQSFSYKKDFPIDESGNGGGFMFDCRGVLNPGRFEEYKKLTGRDKAVIDFLETKTKIGEFLKHAKAIVDISVQDYLARGFENLQISFGCTGGQHRSVYCADSMAKYLKEKYDVHVTVRHLIQDEKKWINE